MGLTSNWYLPLLWCERVSAKLLQSQHETLIHRKGSMLCRSNCSQMCPFREGQTGHIYQTHCREVPMCVCIILVCAACLYVCISREESHLSVNGFHFALSIGSSLNAP